MIENNLCTLKISRLSSQIFELSFKSQLNSKIHQKGTWFWCETYYNTIEYIITIQIVLLRSENLSLIVFPPKMPHTNIMEYNDVIVVDLCPHIKLFMICKGTV